MYTIDLDNKLVSLGNKFVPELMFFKHYDAIWRNYATMI